MSKSFRDAKLVTTVLVIFSWALFIVFGSIGAIFTIFFLDSNPAQYTVQDFVKIHNGLNAVSWILNPLTLFAPVAEILMALTGVVLIFFSMNPKKFINIQDWKDIRALVKRK